MHLLLFLVHCIDVNKDIYIYRQTSTISHTKSLNINVSRLVLQLSLPNPLEPGVENEDVVGAAPTVPTIAYVYTELVNRNCSLHAKPWIPGGGISIFMVAIHQWKSTVRQFYVRVTSQINNGDVTMLSHKNREISYQ